jgi:hypothetical protein
MARSGRSIEGSETLKLRRAVHAELHRIHHARFLRDARAFGKCLLSETRESSS